MILDEVCAYLKNYFQRRMIFSTFSIYENIIRDRNGNEIDFQGGNYFRIIGDKPSLNDGIYSVGEYTLQDDIYEGAIWIMAVPADVIAIADDIEKWLEQYATTDSPALSPYTSESFSGYSYTKSGSGLGSITTGENNTPLWAGSFGGMLARWRKI